MVLDYYKLREQPFGVTPDSRYLFLSSTHREALASLLYGVDSGCGFLAMIATPGLGKTTLLFQVLNQLREKALTVFLFQTVCTPMDLLRALLTGLGVQETQGSLIQMQLRLKEVLLEQARLGKRVVLVIDEAQNLDDSVLELVRMLSNFETSQEKLIQIILSGQPQLAEKIGSPDLEQLRQRVSIFASLKPFSREDTQLYIEHRLRVAGYSFEQPLFTRDAVTLIAEFSDGIPRNINNLCFNALSLGCALQQKLIDSEVLREVIADLNLDRFRKKRPAAGRSEERAHPVPINLSSAKEPSMFRGWMGKLALALAVILVMGGVLFATLRSSTREAAVQSESTEPLAGAAATTSVNRPTTAAPAETIAQSKSGTPAPASASPSPVTTQQPAAAAEAEKKVASAFPPLTVPDPALLSPEQSPQPVATESTVSVTPGKTLLGICVESFGRCNPELLQEIRRLNPRLNNLDHIETGQQIRLPVSAAITEQPDKGPPAERTTHE